MRHCDGDRRRGCRLQTRDAGIVGDGFDCFTFDERTLDE